MTSVDVSVLLVNWNTCAETRRCLASLPDAVTEGLHYEVIVVDNGSTDGSLDMLAAYRDIVLIRNSDNVGFAAAVNQAYAHANGELILLLNSDVRFRPGALAALVRFLRDRPEAAGVAPLYLDSHGAVQQHYMRLPTFRSALALGTALRFLPGFRHVWRAHVMEGVDFSKTQPVPQPSASCLLLRRGVLDPERVFDERFPLYFNDVLLARTLADAGHQLWMTPQAVVTHTLGASTGLLGESKRTAHRLDGLIRYVRLTQPRRRLRILQALVLLDRLARRMFGVRGQLRLPDLWAAIRGGLGSLPDIDRREWVVILSGVGWERWSAGEHRQHALAKTLSAGRRVLFVDPPARRRCWRLSVRQVQPGLWHAIAPNLLPCGRLLPAANWINRRIAAARLNQWLDRHPGARLLWLDEDLSTPVAGRLGERALVYDVSDLDWTFARPWNRWHHRREMHKAVNAADLVLTSSSVLPRWLPPSQYPPVTVPNGCDPARFCPEGRVTESVSKLSGPRLGYAGAIDTRCFDGELIAEVARRRPDWTFVLTGPSTRAGRAPLANLGNVHLLGSKHFDDVPAVLRACDVCLIPYRLGGLVDYVHPKKLYEYLALGKPVVATALPALAEQEDVVHLADTPERFIVAIDKALTSSRSADAASQRRAVAMSHSWSVRGEQLRVLLGELEGRRR
ncbi:glycosyltransferase [Saccharopolyspora mangrovi]|uniref:Glycosyltransferase n=1 Tax=Saccharopolyspora mangrovi TaxID=3082379 RepID=A0ABU6AEN0_9PSEU|nr:glycosyltransferase [Saccharopolyspora sp. S2-29]MEB3369994.1 glycosyltransferase [Saccharopolyspora sp. S2-29]